MLFTKRSTVFITTACALSLITALAGCENKNQQGAHGQMPPTEVSVFTVKLGEHPLKMELTGRAQAYREAEIRPQVNGLLQKRLYQEGTEVKKGQTLYQIDPAPYEAALAAAEASVAQAQATLTKAKADAARSSQLLKANAVSKQADDAVQAAYLQAQASLKSAQANLNTAKINLTYTRVLSPIDGLVGRSEFTEGALMTAYQSNKLTTVQQLDPMYVDVVQTADNVLAMKAQIANGQLKTDAEGNAKVQLKLPTGELYPHEGKLTFRGVSVDESTGSVNLRMEFPNPERILMPGLYVTTNVVNGGVPNSALVSMQAVMHDAKGQAYVYVVNKDSKIERRNVIHEGSQGAQWLITSGLRDGDKVVFDGFSDVAVGKEVKAKDGDPLQLQQNGKSLF